MTANTGSTSLLFGGKIGTAFRRASSRRIFKATHGEGERGRKFPPRSLHRQKIPKEGHNCKGHESTVVVTFFPEYAKLEPCTCSGSPPPFSAPFPWPPATP